VSQPALRSVRRLTTSARRLAWPWWMLLLLACLPVTQLLPAGYARAVVAAPVLLTAPGSVTLAVAFRRQRRPSEVAFICWAVLLSVAWLAFASLALSVVHIKITTISLYLCLLIITAAMAAAARRRMRGPRSAGWPAVPYFPDTGDPARPAHPADPYLAEPWAGQALPPRETGPAARPATAGGIRYALVAAVAGLALLAGAAYARDHLPHPAPVGYTWLAWTGPQVKGVLPIGADGRTIPFQVVHHERGTVTFQLTADWQGSPQRVLAGPQTFTVGPERTFRGTLFVPPLPNGCVYRVVLTLSRLNPAGSASAKPQTWSINADVRTPGKPLRRCGS
jgi:hypothetical protein